jgi:HSP20 family protein
MIMLMRTDPFRELDRLTEQVLGTTTRPAVMAMDAWRDGDEFIVEFDLPGVKAQDVDLDVERNVLTVKAERPSFDVKDTEMIAAERPRGVFSRQLFLGDNLDTDRVKAEYDAGVLRLTIPVSEQAKPHKSRSPTTATAGPSSPDPKSKAGSIYVGQFALPCLAPFPDREVHDDQPGYGICPPPAEDSVRADPDECGHAERGAQ